MGNGKHIMKNAFLLIALSRKPVVLLENIALFLLLTIFLAPFNVGGEGGERRDDATKQQQDEAIQRGLASANGEGPEISAADVVATCLDTNRFPSLDGLMNSEYFYHAKRERLCQELVAIFRDKRRSEFARGAAAYYLGEMRAPEAADDLASEITFEFDLRSYHGDRIPSEDFMAPVLTAVLKIGFPALPALARNLETSDDTKVRRSSLEAIYGIDGKDTEMTQFRLRHAVDGQQDLKKKARLQSALELFQSDPEFSK
jgi:hypothetical protein